MSENPVNIFADALAEMLLRCASSKVAESSRDVMIRLVESTAQANICIDLEDEYRQRQEDIINSLKQSGLAGDPGDFRPMICERSRLYLYRMFKYEKELSEKLLQLADEDRIVSGTEIRGIIEGLFGSDADDMQKASAALAARKRLCIITGGPGTGKTTTLAKIIALMLKLNREMTIALAAPTGKAADRMREAIVQATEKLNIDDDIKRLIPKNSSTLHRLLGYRPDNEGFTYSSSRRLPYDLVVLDEASMVDLRMMSRLSSALKPGAGLILLGDSDQLASVDAGYVLGDICSSISENGYTKKTRAFLEESTGIKLNTAGNVSSLQDCLVRLTKTYRFRENSGLFVLMRAVQTGDANAAAEALSSGEYDDISIKGMLSEREITEELKPRILSLHKRISTFKDLLDKLSALNGFKVLCALRGKSFGAEGINEACIEILRQAGLISRTGISYEGKPIIITRNDYSSGLFNGDIGIIAKDTVSSKRLFAYFRPGEGRAEKFLAAELPENETAYCMTIHKSQGSESDGILMILPPYHNRVMTRELIYTGITRAKSKLEIWGSIDVLKNSILTPTRRNSGLTEKLA